MSPSPLSYQDYQPAVPVLRNGGIAVLPTDTIYGLVCSALKPKAVDQLFELKQRARTKPCIVLIPDASQLGQFKIELTTAMRGALEQVWSDASPTSVVLPCENDEWHYLHGGTGSLAFRVPRNQNLLQLLSETGPLLAPSANPEGLQPAETTREAKAYFGDQIAVYVDGGTLKSAPSRLIELDQDGSYETLRK